METEQKEMVDKIKKTRPEFDTPIFYRTDFLRKNPEYKDSDIKKYFGTWQKALKKAGMKTREDIYNPDYFKKELQQLEKDHGRAVTKGMYKREGRHSLTTVLKYVDWDELSYTY